MNLTQAEVAERCGLPSQSISYYETANREPDLDTLAVVARALGSTWFEIMTDVLQAQTLDEQRKSTQTEGNSAAEDRITIT